mmetsp:Transcript_31676/g.46427  ORF Transcript_31676/g.46427 Transcript_31676/m.46427 type:complete len:133 (-) Transcript_31676:114-512(-)
MPMALINDTGGTKAHASWIGNTSDSLIPSKNPGRMDHVLAWFGWFLSCNSASWTSSRQDPNDHTTRRENGVASAPSRNQILYKSIGKINEPCIMLLATSYLPIPVLNELGQFFRSGHVVFLQLLLFVLRFSF